MNFKNAIETGLTLVLSANFLGGSTRVGESSGQRFDPGATGSDKNPPITREYPYLTGQTVVHFRSGATLFCRENQPIGLQYPPLGSISPSGPGNCDVLIPRDQIDKVTVDGRSMIIPGVSKGIIPSQLVSGK